LLDFCTQAKQARPPLVLQGITIDPSPQHKFLGVIIDHTLSWSTQTAYALAKGMAYILQLKRLSSTSFGIPVTLMKRLYLAVALPKTLYAVDVWIRPIYKNENKGLTPGSKGVIRKLNSIQRTAMLSITGAMHTSPTDSLKILSNTWPLSHHIQNLCHQVALRLAAVPNTHPLHLFVSRAATNFVKRHRSSIHYLMKAFDINPEAIEPLTCSQIPDHIAAPDKTHIAPNVEQAITELEALLQSRQTVIYSDGSRMEVRVGAAVAYLSR
jgi:hypothetical protein